MRKWKVKELATVKTRKGTHDYVIVATRLITRGRARGRTEYTLAPLCDMGDTYALKVTGESYLGECTKEYTDAQIEHAIESERESRNDERDRKRKIADRGRDAIGTPQWNRPDAKWGRVSGSNIAVGDEAHIQYRDGRLWRVVIKINYATGKVQVEEHRRKNRWFHPDHILDVRKQRRALNAKLPEHALDQMGEQGWAQIRFTNGEFIVRSIVVAFESEAAHNGTNLDGSSDVVFYDENLKLYWRETGSFD